MRAFSLIELLIVMAIVGVLAAIAVPVYKQYSVRASIASSAGVIDATIQKTIQLYSSKGTFSDAADAGFTPHPSRPHFTDFTSGKLNDILVALDIYGQSPSSACPTQTIVAFYTNFGHGDAFANPPGDYVVAEYMLIDVNGTFTIRCSSAYVQNDSIADPSSVVLGPGMDLLPGNFVNNCPNFLDNPAYATETQSIRSTACL